MTHQWRHIFWLIRVNFDYFPFRLTSFYIFTVNKTYLILDFSLINFRRYNKGMRPGEAEYSLCSLFSVTAESCSFTILLLIRAKIHKQDFKKNHNRKIFANSNPNIPETYSVRQNPSRKLTIVTTDSISHFLHFTQKRLIYPYFPIFIIWIEKKLDIIEHQMF